MSKVSIIGIEEDMVDGFNDILIDRRSIIRLIPNETSVSIATIEDDYLAMEDQIINPTRDFYNDLENFFMKNGVKISYNNTRSTFWKDNTTQ